MLEQNAEQQEVFSNSRNNTDKFLLTDSAIVVSLVYLE